MKFSVKGAPHKRRVAFACAACTAPLESPLEDAGQTFACPTCGRDVLTPGTAELEQQRREEEVEKARREAEQRANALRAAQEQRQREAQTAAEHKAKEAQRAQREQSRAAARAKRRYVSVAEFAIVIVLLGAGVHFAFVRPLQLRLAATQLDLATTQLSLRATTAQLNGLVKAVEHNAEAANRTAEALGSLSKTVDHNANVANGNTDSLRNSVSRLASSLAETDALAQNANRHAHSHSRF